MAILKKWTVVAIVMIAYLSSCTINEVHEEYMNSFTKDYIVYPNNWHVGEDDESGYYFYFEFRETNLTQDIYDYGVMQAFLKMNDGNITPLPFNDYWYNVQEGTHSTEQVTCEFRPGYVTFILKYSHHDITLDPYYNYNFKVRFLW